MRSTKSIQLAGHQQHGPPVGELGKVGVEQEAHIHLKLACRVLDALEVAGHPEALFRDACDHADVPPSTQVSFDPPP